MKKALSLGVFAVSVVLVVVTVFFNTPFLFAADTGLKVPTAIHDPNNWDTNTVGSIQFSDNVYVSDNDDEQQGYSTFSFGIPAGASIQGIEVIAEARSSDADCDIGASLSWNNGTSYTSMDSNGAEGSDSTETFGGSSDTWGRTWSASDFSDANFVVRVQGIDSGFSCDNSATTFIDQLQVRVHYTPIIPTTTVGDGVSPASKGVAASQADRAVSAFTLSANTGVDTVTSLTVTGGGTGLSNVAASGVKIYQDNGTTANEWDASDTLKGTASLSGTVATFPGINLPVTTTSIQYLITYDIVDSPTSGTMTGEISGATATNVVTDNDNTDATLTVDFAPPTLEVVTPVPIFTNDNTPSFTFSSSETGTINYTGVCTSAMTAANSGNTTVTFGIMSDGLKSGCTLKVTDGSGNQSDPLDVGDFTIDTQAPSGGSISYADGSYGVLSVPITYTLGSDNVGGSGLDTSTGFIQRRFATLTGSTCGSYNSYATLVTEFDGAHTDTTVTSGRCYQYQYVIEDQAGNSVTYNNGLTAKVQVSHTITASAGGGGSITPSGSVNVAQGANQAFSTVPATGSIVADVVVDSVSQGRIQAYTFSSVSAPHTITSSFDGGWSAASAASTVSGSPSNTTNAFSSNDSYATFDSDSDVADFKNFNLAVPVGATINGIEVATEGVRDSGGTARVFSLNLSWNNGTNFATAKSGVDQTTTQRTVISGNSGDKWGSHTWVPSDFVNGAFTVRLDPISANGNLNIDQMQVKVHYTLDTTDPDTSITDQPASLTNSTSANFAFTSTEANSTFECQIDGGGFSACTTPKSYVSLTDGSHTFDVRATDVAGNTDATPASYTWTIDTAAPSTVIDSATDGNSDPVVGGGLTDSNSISIAYTATDANGVAASNCKIDADSYAACGANPKTYLGLGDGSHTVSISSTDTAGNVENTAVFTWTIDATDPVITLNGDAEITLEYGDAYTDAGATANDASTVVVGGDTVDTETLGDYIVTYNATDAAGNAALEVTRTVHVVEREVTVTADSGQAKMYGENDPTFTYQLTSGTLVGSDDFGGALSRDAGEAVGSYALTVGDLSLGDNYAITFVSANFAITTRAVEVTADPATKVFGDDDPELTYQITDGSLAFTDDFTGALTRDAGESVASYAITQGTLALGANYVLSFVDDSLSITKADATIVVTAYDVTYDGNAHTAAGTATGVNGEDLSADLDLSDTTHTDGGAYNDDPWTFTDTTGNYNDASGDVDDSIEKADATCAVNGTTVTYDGVSHGATGSCFGVEGETLADLDLGESFTDVPGGTANWTFTDTTGNYDDRNDSVEIVIDKADADVTVTGYTGTYDSVAHGAGGSATGVDSEDLSADLDLGESFTDVPGGTAHWTFDGGTNYESESGDVSIVISQASAIVAVTPYSVTYDGDAHTTVGTATGIDGEDLSAGLDLSGTTHTAAGSYVGDAWTFEGGANYGDQNGTVDDSITKAGATIVVDDYSGMYDGVPHGVTGTATGVNDDDLSADLDLGLSYANVPGGTASWTFTDTTGNYEGQSGTAQVTITQADSDCSVDGTTVTYDGVSHGATGSCFGVEGETLAGLDLGESFTDVPGGTANWTFTDTTGNYNDQNGTVDITIDLADATCTVTGYIGDFDAASHGALGSCVGTEGELSGLDLGDTFTNVPGGVAHWVFTDATGNYGNEDGDVDVTITKADATITVTPYDVEYDGTEHVASGSAFGVLGESLSGLDLLNTKHIAAGTYSDTWTFTDITGNYNDDTDTVSDQISKVAASITVTGYSVTYDGSEHIATVVATGVNGEDLSADVDLSATAHTAAGDYPVDPWSYSDTVGNYEDQSGTVANHIDEAAVVCTINGYIGVYDGASHGATGSCVGVEGTLSGLDLGDSFANVPGGTVHWVYTDETGNYADQSGDVSIALSKADPVVTVTGYDVVYDGDAHTATGDAKGVLDETLAGLDLSGTTHTDVGTYTDTWTFTDITGNYNDDTDTVSDKITEASASVTLSDLSQTYDGSARIVTATTDPVGLTVDITYDASPSAPVNAGSYAVVATINDANYAGSDSDTLVVGKAAVSVTADNQLIEFGSTDPEFTFDYGAFEGTDDSSVVDTEPTCGVSGAHAAVGIYPIECSGGVDSNYDFSYVSGTLTVQDTIAPLVDITAPADGGTTGREVTAQFTVSDASADIVCELDTVSVPCTATDATLPDLGGGSHTFQVTATDGADNSSFASVTWNVDATGPVVSISSPADGSTVAADVAFLYTTGDAATFSCEIDSTPVGSECDADGFSQTLANGAHTFEVAGTDSNGNETTALVGFTVDNEGPSVTIDNGPTGTVESDSASFEFSGVDASSFTCKLDLGTEESCASPKNYNGLSEGEHIFSVYGTDTFGNDGASATRDWTVDADGPVFTLEDAGNATENSITVTWTTSHPATSRVVYDTAPHASLGSAPNYGYANSTSEDTNLVTNHSVTVTGLTSGTTYYFRGVSHGSPESVGGEVSEATTVTQPTTGSLKVIKVANGGDSTFSFTGPSGSFQIITGAGSGETTLTNLAPGNYSVTENTHSGWTMNSNTCTNVAVVANQTATCTVTNTKDTTPPPSGSGKGKLTIIKKTLGGDSTFTFTGSAGTFTIKTKKGVGAKVFKKVPAGVYTITETAQSGWTMTENTCANVEVKPNKSVTCTVKNTKNAPPAKGSVAGQKFWDRNGNGVKDGNDFGLPGWIVYLDSNDDGGYDWGEPFRVTGFHGEYKFGGLVAKTYYVREVMKRHWSQTVPGTGVITVELAPGQNSTGNDFGNTKGAVQQFQLLSVPQDNGGEGENSGESTPPSDGGTPSETPNDNTGTSTPEGDQNDGGTQNTETTPPSGGEGDTDGGTTPPEETPVTPSPEETPVIPPPPPEEPPTV